MSLNDIEIPVELFKAIIKQTSLEDLSSISCLSKLFRNLTEPRLYERIDCSWDENSRSISSPVYLLLGPCWGAPSWPTTLMQLSLMENSLSGLGRCPSTSFHQRWSVQKVSSGMRNSRQTAVDTRAAAGKHRCCHTMVLCTFSKLEYLDIDLDTETPMVFIPGMLEHALLSPCATVTISSFHSVTHERHNIGCEWITQWGWDSRNFCEVRALLYLPCQGPLVKNYWTSS